MSYQNIYHLLKFQSEKNPDAIALLAPEREPATHLKLFQQIEYLAGYLREIGIKRNDRVAIVLPNGPEMASSFLGVASCATSAPLNPYYRYEEFDYYLSDLNAKALLIKKDFESPARNVARNKGIQVIEITVNNQKEAGVFSLLRTPENNLPVDFALTEDVALVLHTSGTTSKPKIVPLTQKNIYTSAFNIAKTLQLTSRDRCLNVMPLFHIHGLMAAVLSSLSAGSSIVCTPGFNAEDFFKWLTGFQPSWYTAVPTMHQAILAKSDFVSVSKNQLRFLRSSSSSLPPQIMRGLEELFNAPMIEAYGMTEASHQMTSNPLPPLARKPGSVGIAAGPEVKIMDNMGNFLAVGETGEIVIKGENVTTGYENNPGANKDAIIGGWFRTGDEGVMDTEGYLTITGRLKEMINRGGEKIIPREVDEILLSHPAVAQAVTFALTHSSLGEDVAAAVVLKNGLSVSEKELRDFVFSKLADYKVPSQIIFVNEIPKGPTGKMQRIGLAKLLISKLEPVYLKPQNSLEESLVAIWQEILGVIKIGIHNNFFSLGGDSLSALAVTTAIEEQLGKKIDPSILFRSPTIEQLSAQITGEYTETKGYLLPMRSGGDKPPIFLVPGHGGDVFTYIHVLKYLEPAYPVYVFQFPLAARTNDDTANSMLKEMAKQYIDEIRLLQPEGPYNLGGFCFGGELVFEMAQQLRLQGQKTSFLALIYVNYFDLNQILTQRLSSFIKSDFKNKVNYLKKFSGKLLNIASSKILNSFSIRKTMPLVTVYHPQKYTGKILLLEPEENITGKKYNPKKKWEKIVDDLEFHYLPGNRKTIFKEPNAKILAEKLNSYLERIKQMA